MNADGTVDTSFTTSASNPVRALSEIAAAKQIAVGVEFLFVGGDLLEKREALTQRSGSFDRAPVFSPGPWWAGHQASAA